MSQENDFWYLKNGSIGSGLGVQATYPIRMIILFNVVVIELRTQISFSISLGIECLAEIYTGMSLAW